MTGYGVVGAQPVRGQERVIFLNQLPTNTSTAEILAMMEGLSEDGKYEYFDERFMTLNTQAGDHLLDYTIASGFVLVDSNAQFEILPRGVWKVIYKDDIVVTREDLCVGPVVRVIPTHYRGPAALRFVPQLSPRGFFGYQSPYFSSELVVIWKGAQHRLNDDICAFGATCKTVRECIDASRAASGVVIFQRGLMSMISMVTGSMIV